MKIQTLKITSVLFFVLISFLSVSVVQAQQRATEPDQGREVLDETTPNYEAMTNEQVKKDFSSRITKYEELYNKLKQKAEKARNPEMKTDINNLLVKMEALKNDMTSYQNGSSTMSQDQQKQAIKNIQSKMEELRTIHTDLKTKYGAANKSDKGSKTEQMEQTTPK